MSTPAWGSVLLKNVVAEAVTFLRRHKPLGIEPRVMMTGDAAVKAVTGANIWWEIGKGAQTVGIGVHQIIVDRPLLAIRLGVTVSWPAVSVDAADAVAQAILHRSIADIACILRKSLAGHHWNVE